MNSLFSSKRFSWRMGQLSESLRAAFENRLLPQGKLLKNLFSTDAEGSVAFAGESTGFDRGLGFSYNHLRGDHHWATG